MNWINIIGLVFDLLGAILLFLFVYNSSEMDQVKFADYTGKRKWWTKFSKLDKKLLIPIGLLAIGFFLQIISNFYG